MKIEILEHKKNVLLNREEIMAVIESSITPSIKQAAEIISEKVGKPFENIVVSSVKGQFGSNYFKVFAKVYHDIQSKQKYEVVTRKHRKKLADDMKKAKEEMKKAEEQSKQEASE